MYWPFPKVTNCKASIDCVEGQDRKFVPPQQCIDTLGLTTRPSTLLDWANANCHLCVLGY